MREMKKVKCEKQERTQNQKKKREKFHKTKHKHLLCVEIDRENT